MKHLPEPASPADDAKAPVDRLARRRQLSRERTLRSRLNAELTDLQAVIAGLVQSTDPERLKIEREDRYRRRANEIQRLLDLSCRRSEAIIRSSGRDRRAGDPMRPLEVSAKRIERLRRPSSGDQP